MSISHSYPLTYRRISVIVAVVAAIWAATVTFAAASGLLASLYMPLIAALVAVGIAVPTLAYLALPVVRAWVDWVGLRRLTALHIWRIPAALMFFWYGLNGELPPVFWILAGTGDLAAGLWALRVSSKADATPGDYRAMHRFGLADFVVAVGTGLFYTLISDPRMAPVASLPLALIPLFGVGLSGATHLAAFDMLRRGVRV